MVKADLVLKNGKIATVDKNFNYVQAVAVRDGWIIDRGTDAEMEAYVGPDTKVIDAGGKLVLPGANDSHMHAVHTGYTLSPSFLDFSGPSYDCMEKILTQVKPVTRPGLVNGCLAAVLWTATSRSWRLKTAS